MDFLTFRDNAWAGIALAKNNKSKPFPNHWSRNDWEKWIKQQYNRKYPIKMVTK